MPPQLAIRKPTPINAQLGPDVPPPDPMTLGAPPMPPQPTSPAAGFQAWVADPMNQAKVPAPIPAKTPLIPTQQEYFQQHPEQEQTPLLMGRKWTGLAQGLFAALQDIGRPGAGSERLQGLMQHDINIPQTNAQIYRAGAVQPVLDQTSVQQAQNAARKSGYEADIEGNRAQLGPMADPQIQEFYNTVAKNKNELAQLWQSGQYTPDQFDKVVQSRMAANPYMARFVDPGFIQQVKGLPQQPPSFKFTNGTLEPITYQGKVYGPTPEPGESPLVTDARQKALDSQRLKNENDISPIQAGGRSLLADKTGRVVKDMGASTPVVVNNLQNQGATGGAIAKALADGSMKWQDVVSPRTPMSVKSELLSEVKAIKPDFNSGDYSVEQKVKEVATSGDVGKQLLAIGTAREHMKLFSQLFGALDNGDNQTLNRIGNSLGVEFGSDKATNMRIAAQAFGGEVGRAFDGAGVVASERQQAEKSYSDQLSKGQGAGAVQTVDKLLAGKQKAAQDWYNKGVQAKPDFGTGGGHVIQMNGKNYRYNGTGDTSDIKNYSEVKQ